MERQSNGNSKSDSLLKALFIDQLQDIYWAEKHLVKALTKMENKTTTDELAMAFNSHLSETIEHVSRLEEVFALLEEKSKAKKCEAMNGIIEEAESIISDTESDTLTRDVGLIMAGQKAEHYEIATYGCLITLANTLGLKQASQILKSTLKEEKAADEKLTQIAESWVNEKASHEA